MRYFLELYNNDYSCHVIWSQHEKGCSCNVEVAVVYSSKPFTLFEAKRTFVILVSAYSVSAISGRKTKSFTIRFTTTDGTCQVSLTEERGGTLVERRTRVWKVPEVLNYQLV
jgi:hypothetical protein